MDRHAWDHRYAEVDFLWSQQPNELLPPAVEGVPPGRALDLACGEGRNALYLASLGWDVVGVDFSEVAIERAKEMARERGLEGEFVVDDVFVYEPEPTFNLVMLFFVHFTDTHMVELFDVARRALAPGGRFIGLGHDLRNLTDGYSGPQVPEILWTEDRIRPLLDGLVIDDLSERLRPIVARPGEDVPEGTTAIDLWFDARRA